MYLGNPFEHVDPLLEVVNVDDDQIDLSKCLTAGELGKLLDAVLETQPQWHGLAMTLALTSGRFGEVTALKWTDVDFDGRRIVVSRAQTRGHFDTTKTSKRSQRRVKILPLGDELAEVLRAHRREQVARQVRGLDTGLVFPSAVGKPYSGTSGLNAALKKAAEHDELGRKPTAKWFRHTLNNLLRQVTSAQVTRSITGHMTEEMTEHYSDVSLQEKAEAVDQVVRLVDRSQTFRGER